MNSFLFNVKKHLKTIIFLFVTALLCFAFSLLNGNISKSSSVSVLADIQEEVVKKLDDEIIDSYLLGDIAEFPSSVEIDDEGDTITATFGEVVMPNNDITNETVVPLEQLGEYIVKYYYQKDGKIDFAEKTILVGNKFATINGEGGSITPVTADEQVGVVYENNATNTTLSGNDALIVRLQENYKFQYTKSIDLTQTDENGFIEIMSLDYHLRDVIRNATNFELTGRSADFAYIRMTDSYDPSIYVELAAGVRGLTDEKPTQNVMLSIKPHNHPKYSVAMATWKENQRENNYLTHYTHPNSQEWGIYSFVLPDYGLHAVNQTSLSPAPVTWRYNPTTQMIHASFALYGGAAKDRFMFDMTMDNIGSVATCDAFTGFPSGKINLTITTSDWGGVSDARFDIYSIAGVSGDELINEYKEGIFVDDVAKPLIDLGMNTTKEDTIYLANNSEYTIPTPTKIYGGINDKDYFVNAYVNYGSPTQYEVPINDGKLAINKPVMYTLKYSAKGKNGTVGEKLLHIISKDVDEALKLNVDESFFGGTFESGQNVVLPEFSVDTINRSDSIKTKIKLVHDKYTKEISTYTRDFILEYAGEHKIVYEYSDNVFSLSKEYVINVGTSDNIGFINKIAIPKYFIKNAYYSLPELSAYTLGGGEHVEQTVTAEISYDNGATWTTINREKVKITGDDTAIVKYSCGTGANKTSVVSSPSKIIDVEYGRAKKDGGILFREYFYHEGFSIQEYDKALNNASLTYKSNVTSGNNTLEFINAVDFKNFEFRFKMGENSNYSKVNFSLIDFYDHNLKYVLSYTNVGGIGYLSFNGEESNNTALPFVSTKAKAWTYDYASNVMSFDGQTRLLDLTTYFNSSLCYINIEFIGITGETDFTIDSVNYQTLKNNATADTAAPRISNKDFTGSYKVGDIITITAPTVTDVLSPALNENIKVKVVRVADNSVVSDVNNVPINNLPGIAEYQFRVDSLGEYKVTYSFVDGVGKSSIKNYPVYVVDTKKPEITFDKVKFTEFTIEVGTTIDASYTVTDDVSVADKILTSLSVRDLNTQAIYSIYHENNLILFNLVGRFMVYAFAQDEAGNYVYTSFIVNVKEVE